MYPVATPFAQSGAPAGNGYFSYTYDSMGRPVSLAGPNGNWAQGAQYDYAGRLTSLQYMVGLPAGTPAYTTETMAYNSASQMISQSWSTPSSLGPIESDD